MVSGQKEVLQGFFFARTAINLKVPVYVSAIEFIKAPEPVRDFECFCDDSIFNPDTIKKSFSNQTEFVQVSNLRKE